VTSAATIAVIAGGCSGAASPAVTGPVPEARVTAAQRAAITRYYLTNLWTSDGNPHVACPVDVLGAAHIGHRLRVYTVVHCTSTPHCARGGTNYTNGLVVDLAGTSVAGVQQDDAVMESEVVSEARIYPPSLRSRALNDVNYGGPAWLRNLAAKNAGCLHGLH
jgi:hypothetical protein